jgi:hypothetical protein
VLRRNLLLRKLVVLRPLQRLPRLLFLSKAAAKAAAKAPCQAAGHQVRTAVLDRGKTSREAAWEPESGGCFA